MVVGHGNIGRTCAKEALLQHADRGVTIHSPLNESFETEPFKVTRMEDFDMFETYLSPDEKKEIASMKKHEVTYAKNRRKRKKKRKR